MTTYLDAAYHILHHAGQPLRYEESRMRLGPAIDLAPGPRNLEALRDGVYAS